MYLRRGGIRMASSPHFRCRSGKLKMVQNSWSQIVLSSTRNGTFPSHPQAVLPAQNLVPDKIERADGLVEFTFDNRRLKGLPLARRAGGGEVIAKRSDC